MVICSNCNKEFEEEIKYCDNCGQKLLVEIHCPKCGGENSVKSSFCYNCGEILTKEENINYVNNENKKQKIFSLFNMSKKIIVLLSTCLVLVLIALIVLPVISVNNHGVDYVVYVKEKELYFSNITKFEPWQITEKLIDADEPVKNEDFDDGKYEIGDSVYLCTDGKTLIYTDKNTDDADGINLYYRNINKPKEESVKIDSDIISYSVNDSENLITYLKGEDGALYQHNLKEKNKIDSDVGTYYVSSDGKNVLYSVDTEDNEKNLYIKLDKKEKEKFESNISSIDYVSEDLKTVYYVKDSILYKKTYGGDKVKLASDVSRVIKVYETGEVYYRKDNKNEYAVLDLIEDEFKSSDASFKKPKYPSYPYSFYYDTTAEYKVAKEQYEKDCDAYEEAMERYEEKTERDYLRNSLADDKINIYTSVLCYHNGTEEKILKDNVTNDISGNRGVVAENSAVISFAVLNFNYEKVKLSELINRDDSSIENILYSTVTNSIDNYISIKGNVMDIQYPEACNFNIKNDGTEIYFSDNNDVHTGVGEIYKISVSGGQAKQAELYDSEVYSSSIHFYNDKLIYAKNENTEGNLVGELYINKKLIDYDVLIYSCEFINDTNDIVYYSDWNKEKKTGTLKILKNNKSEKIADDVYDFVITPNNEILYLNNYNNKAYRGDLSIYDGKSKKLDEDVVCIIPFISGFPRGEWY